MNERRNFLLAAACATGAGIAYGLVPRKRVSLMTPGKSVADIIPRTFGAWRSRDVTDLVAPKVEDSLAYRLYGETVGRIYAQGQDGPEIMMLLAHGDTQSDDLQLHRPEICYPAFGYAIANSEVALLAVSPSVTIPSRKIIAKAPDRIETIVYWSRLGEFLPLDRKEQQLDRLRTAMMGQVSDGLLARFSVLGADSNTAFAVMGRFIPSLVRAVARESRDVLIGTKRAAALSAAGF